MSDQTQRITIQEPSLKSLFLQTLANGNPIGTGTGFVVTSARGPMLISNRHIVTGRHNQTNQILSPTGTVPDSVAILHNRSGQVGQWVPRLEPLLNVGGRSPWHEHPTLGARADFVALPLTQLDDVELHPYRLEGDPLIQVLPADTVSIVGFPFGIRSGGALAIWATGFVATEPAIDHDGLPILLVDCRARPGQSGSAVIAHRNGGMVALEDGSTAVFARPVTRFLGVYSGRINDQSDLGIVWKVSAISRLVEGLT